MFVDKSTYLQFIPDTLTELFAEHGWSNFLKYRIFSSDTVFADVRLFRSVGSDLQTRYLGMVHGYDTSKTPFKDNRIIMSDSHLGMVGTGDGEKTLFKVPVAPIDPTKPLYVYVNGTVVGNTTYEVDDIRGNIVFKTAPAQGDVITVTYTLHKKAPEPPSKFYFFTFNAVYMETNPDAGGAIKIGDGDGVKVDFSTPTAPIKYQSLKVYVDGVLVTSDKYTVDWTTGKIIFNEPPLLGKEITVEYIEIVGGATVGKAGDGDGVNKVFYTPQKPIATNKVVVYNNGRVVPSTEYTVDHQEGMVTFNVAPKLGSEITVEYTSLVGGPPVGETTLVNDFPSRTPFTPSNGESLMGAVFDSMSYMYPSPPTAMSLTSLDNLGLGWQRDSLFYYWGDINKDRASLHCRLDPAGGADAAYYVPLYFGRLFTKGQAPRKNMVLLSGCRETDEIKYAKDKKLGRTSIDYGPNTSNGNDGVMIQQTLGGSYYQRHYLSFITHSKQVDNGDGRYNPSIYSKKYHFSRLGVVHPNDGFVGEFDDTYAIHPKNIYQLNELEVEKDVFDESAGKGDGSRIIFHSRRKALPGTLKVKVACAIVPETDYEYDHETKQIKFKSAPASGAEVLLEYKMAQVYRYTLATTPKVPHRLDTITPFNPIATAVFKEEFNNG